MDSDRPLWNWLVLLFAGLFCVSCFKSCVDLQYRWGGNRTTAEVIAVGKNLSRHAVLPYQVSYTYRPANSHQPVTGSTPIGWDDFGKYAAGQAVDIEYLGGELLRSRIVGSGSPFWTRFLLLSLGASVVLTVALTLRSYRKVPA